MITSLQSATGAEARRPVALSPGLRRTLHLGWSRTIIEVKEIIRDPMGGFFLLLLPVLLLLVFGSIFDDTIEGTGVSRRQYFVAGIIASSVVGTTFSNLAIGIAVQRHQGVLKRLGGTPLPRTSYFIGRIGAASAVTLVQDAVILAIGVLAFGVDLPQSGTHWLRLGWVLILGVAVGCTLGLAYTRLIPSAKSAPAITQPPYLILQFISGVFFVFTELPGWMQNVATVFPLRWIAQGLRSVFLPDAFGANEAGGGWQLEWVAGVLAIWLVVGTLLALRGFRWTNDGAA